MTREEYIRFMNNPDNILNCDKCPERQDYPSWEMPYPCGQQHCWVQIHVQARDEYED